MNIKKVDAGVWVKVENELPDKRQNCFVKIWTPLQNGYAYYGTRLYDGQTFEHKDEISSFDRDKVVEWLKPVEGYVLSEQEITDIKFQEYNKGYSEGVYSGQIPF